MKNTFMTSLLSFCLCLITPYDLALMDDLPVEEAAALVAHVDAHHGYHEQAAVDSDDEDEVICSWVCCSFLARLWHVQERRERMVRQPQRRSVRKRIQRED